MPVVKPVNAEYICPACKASLAPLYEHPSIPGIYALGGLGLLIENLDGVCVNCGASVHFRVNSQLLRRLVRDMDVEGIEL